MQRVNLNADLREGTGKGVARTLRRAGKVPGVLYSSGRSLLLSLNPSELKKVLHTSAGENVLVNLSIQGVKEKGDRTAIFRDFQYDPVKGTLLHIDLFEIAMDEMIRVRVPLEITGNIPVGVKNDRGVLQHHLREVEIECLPLQIPEKIAVDASELQVGESIHVRDLNVDMGIRILDEEGNTIVSVAAPISDEKLEALLTSPSEGVEKEPELVGKEEKEEEPQKGEIKKGESKKEEPKKEESKKEKK